MATLTSKERVVRTFGRQVPDRVPLNYFANPGIDERLKAHFGLAQDDRDGLLRALKVDFRSVQPRYAGPVLHEPVLADGTQVDLWGIHRRWVEHPAGGYWDYCDFPLRDADVDDVLAWPMPNADAFDYSQIAAQCRRYSEYAVVTGSPGMGDVINSTSMLFHMERVLMGLMDDDPAVLLYIQRKHEVQLEILRRTFEAAEGGIDVLHLGEDLGTQIGPMISKRLYRKALKPNHQRLIDVGKEFGAKVMIHTCGSSSWVYPDFIEMGVDVVDTLQPEAKNMSPAYLKSKFGHALAFQGCISTAGPVEHGTVEETIEDVKSTLAIMMPGGGYCLAPTHDLQDDSPTENVVAMYEAAWEFGVYD